MESKFVKGIMEGVEAISRFAEKVEAIPGRIFEKATGISMDQVDVKINKALDRLMGQERIGRESLDLLDVIPETHGMMTAARARGFDIGYEPRIHAQGIFMPGMKKILSQPHTGTVIGEFFGAKSGTEKNVFTLAHELKHFRQFFQAGDSEGERQRTARAEVMITRVWEADANAFADLIVEKMKVAQALKKEGMSTEDIRTRMEKTADPIKDEQYMRERFMHHITARNLAVSYDLKGIEGKLDDYQDYDLVMNHAAKHGNVPQGRLDQINGALARNPTMAQLCDKLRSDVGPYAYLDDIGDRALAKMILAPMKDEGRKAMWAVDARAAADRRAGGALPSEKRDVIMEKAEKKVNRLVYGQDKKPSF